MQFSSLSAIRNIDPSRDKYTSKTCGIKIPLDRADMGKPHFDDTSFLNPDPLMAPRVSVVIPTFNRAKLVERAIESVLRQTRSADEIILVDDGSTDETTSNIVNKYTNEVLFLTQYNKGVSAARNFGIDRAAGDWIALLDSDDEWLPSKLERQVALIENHTDCLLCHTDEIWIRNGVRVNAMNKHKKSGGDIYQQCLPLCAISPSSVIFQKQLLDDVGNFDETLPACEDYDLWLRTVSYTHLRAHETLR